MGDRLSLAPGVPSAQNYVALRAACGLGERSLAAAERGLAQTLHGVLLMDQQGRVVGMGRLIGDGGCFVQVVDIAVHPDCRGQGAGQRIMAALMAWAEAELPPTCYISLIAAERATSLYARFGFTPDRGMARTIG